MPSRFEAAGTFMWSGRFAATAAMFQVLLDAYSKENDGTRWTKREMTRRLLEVLSISFWGGMSGWAVEHFLPGASGQMLGIVAAVLGSSGHNAMRMFMTGVVERVTGIKFTIEKQAP